MQKLLYPLEWVISWILTFFHAVWSVVFGSNSGWSWTLAIVCMVIVIRILLFPLFVKQVKAQRGMQELAPRLKELQKKYKDDREKLGQETMALYRETGTNPLSSCLPLIVQTPIFFALYRVLQNSIAKQEPIGGLTASLVHSAHNAQIFGVPLWGFFMGAYRQQNGHPTTTGFLENPVATEILCAILIVLMVATTFTTQRQLLVKNVSSDNPMVRQQKILLYVFPFMFLFSGLFFPVGVLIYWLTTNLWTMGQQFWIIRNNPTPDTPAWEAKRDRDQAKAAKKLGGGAPAIESIPGDTLTQEPPKRQQPKKQSRSKRTTQPKPGQGQQKPASPTSADGVDGSPAPDEPAKAADEGDATP
jgi:YidC/Oxa1 family membrane protein insertase